MNNYHIFLNTTDKFEDCWNPFFKLFVFYWPDYKGKIYLNTEYKEYKYPGLNIISIKNCESEKDAHKITWSECLIRGLNKIDEDIILYMQDDYFLKGTVKNNIVDDYVEMMGKTPEIHCIHLTDQGIKGIGQSIYPNLTTVKHKQRYLISCQAALWRKDVLLSYLKSYENAWQFEEFGSKRAGKGKHNFFVVDKQWVQLNKFEIIPYIFTGIIHGMWYKPVISLFAEHNIDIDFTKRGFFGESKPKPISKKIQYQFSRYKALFKYHLGY